MAEKISDAMDSKLLYIVDQCESSKCHSFHAFQLKVIPFSFSLQIVLTVSQTMWCRDITECLITEGDRLEAMKGAEQMCVQVWQGIWFFIISRGYCRKLEKRERNLE